MAVIGRKSGKPNLHIIWRERATNGKRTKRYTSTGTTDRKIADQKLKEFEARRLLGQPLNPALVAPVAQVVDAVAEQRNLKIIGLIEEWAETRVGEKSPRQVAETKGKVLRIANETGMQKLADFTERRVRDFINGMTKKIGGKKRQATTAESAHLSTKNKYRIAAKTFDVWLTKKGYQPARVLQDLGKLIYEGEEKPLQSRVRAEWTMEQVGWLFAAVFVSDRNIEGYSGELRYWLYLCAMTTGFRRKEFGALVPESFQLARDYPKVEIPGQCTKNGDRASQPVPRHMAPLFQRWLAGKEAGQPLFPRLGKLKTGKMLRLDIEGITGLTYKVGRNGYRDFHSLRALFITNSTTSGAAPAVIQQAARHRDGQTTQGYINISDERLHKMANDADRLPVLDFAD